MADFPLGSVEKIIKAAMGIKKAVQTVRQNEVECREIEELAATIMDILLLLQKLVTVCQGRNVACRLLGSGDMSRKLRRVKDDILHKTVLGTFATTVRVTMTLTNTVRHGGAHRLLTQTQDAGEVDISYSSHLTTEDSRFGVNNGITMAATGREVHSAPSSRLTEFNLSEFEDVHRFPGTDIIRQKIVIIVQMTCDKGRCKAMQLVAAMGGVESVAVGRVAVGGDGRGQVVVVGYGLDSIKLTTTLCKKVGPAELLLVGNAGTATHAATAMASARAGRRNRHLYLPPTFVVDWPTPQQAYTDPVHEWLRPMPMKGIVFLFVFLLLLFLRAVSFK